MNTPSFTEIYCTVINPIITIALFAFGLLGWIMAYQLNRDLMILERKLGAKTVEWLLKAEPIIMRSQLSLYLEGLEIYLRELNKKAVVYYNFVRSIRYARI